MNRVKQLPPIGLGTYGSTSNNLIEFIQEALATGYRHIDTAQIYQNEHLIGKGIEESNIDRKQLFITTKVWVDNYSTSHFIPSVKESLEKLRCNRVDLLLLHWPPKEEQLRPMLEELAKCQQKKLCKNIGVSNFTIPQLQLALDMGLKVYANQVEFHPLIDQSMMQSFLLKNNIKLIAYGPFANGQVFGNKTLRNVAAKYQKSIGEIVLEWALKHKNVYPIPKTIHSERLAKNLNIYPAHLNREDFLLINRLSRVNVRFYNPQEVAPIWD